MNSLTIRFRAFFTRDPKPGQIWCSRVDPSTAVKIISNNRLGVLTEWVTGKRPPDGGTVYKLPEAEFVCFWRPMR